MRKKLKLLLVAATLALTIGIISLGGGVVSAPAKAAGSGTLAGFTSSGASVYIATDGTDAKQMRFQIDLTADKAAYAGEGKTAGVVYMPLDVYKVNGVTELTKDTPDAITADVTKNWATNADGSYSSYAYLDPRFIPAGQENRTLVARGYIVDGENVYYTDEVKASMAYVAWKNLDMEEGKYADQLKKYMGPYTLTYGDDGKIENLYYGDTFTLPTSIGTDTVDKWYWDLACTQEIKPTDYATGSMKIYYELRKVAVSGTIACADSSVDLTKTEIYANGKKLAATINASGNYTVNVSIKNAYDLVFKNGNYLAYGNVTVGDDAVTDVNATLKPNTFDIGNYKNTRVSGATFDKNAALDGSVSVNHSSHFMLPMPNTATTEDREYTIDLSQIGDAPSVDFYYGFGLSNGDKVLSFSFSHLNWLRVNISQVGGTGVERVYLFMQKAGWQPKQGKILRTKDEIKLYVDNTYVLSVTKDGITTELGGGWGGINADEFAGFLGENKELALVLNSTGTPMSFTRTYSFSMANIGTVTGTVAAPSGSTDFDLTKVKVYADGNLTEATVAADGTFSLAIPEGTHNFSFETEGYIAYADGVTVGKDAAPITATLLDGTYAIGNYGKVKSSTGGYDKLDALDGTLTVSGQDQMLIMPNTATSEAFTYEVTVSDLVRENDESTIGICVTDGNNRLTVGFRKTWGVELSLDSVSADGANTWYGVGGDRIEGMKLKFVVTKADIKLYVNDGLWFTFTKDGIEKASFVNTLDWGDSLTGVYADRIAGFFADDAKIAVGINSGWKYGASATYTYSVTKYKTVSGAINLPEGADLGTLSLKVDGVGTPITVDTENKTYSAQVLVGTHTFEFANSVVGQCSYKATKTDVNVIDGTNTIDVAASEWGENVLWQVGNYGSVNSTQTPDLNQSGVYTVSGQNQMLIMPNTATSEAFTYEVTVSDITRSNNDSKIGICITDGKYRLGIGLSKDWQVLVSLSQDNGEASHNFYGLGGAQGVDGVKLKFVVTKQDIQFYVNDSLRFTFTSEGITSTINALTDSWVNDTLTGAYTNGIAGFFADNAKIAVGIVNGWNSTATATYTCSITKN